MSGVKMLSGRYKYICLDCHEATWFTRRERMKRGGMLCNYCGSRGLEPSKASKGPEAIRAGHDAHREQTDRRKEKTRGEQ